MNATAGTRATTPAVRRRVVESALQAFSIHGYDAVSIETVRDAAGVSVGSLYHHFQSKAGVAAAVFSEAIDRYHEPLVDIVSADPAADVGVRQLVQAHHHWVAGHADWARFMVTMGDLAEIRADADRRETANASFFDALMGWARPRMRAGTIRALEPLVFSSVLFGPSYFHTRVSLTSSAEPPDTEVWEAFAEAAWNGVAGPSAVTVPSSTQGA